ncbi:hypothetical protein MTR67_031651 [Solanum verrucosum]|uniref:Uncharacterized protein n=1 Tax=Solanum verrucosum TaxID=315347 RepID=A0AAF0ZE50_SOLVR|nr:hypothetical protein MTR67_031651 [Solanum verrucosum]
MLSAIVVDKGLGKGETIFLVALVMIKPDVKVEVPDCVAKVLKQFLDLMPPKVPMKMPSRRDIDHKIELLPGSIWCTCFVPKEAAWDVEDVCGLQGFEQGDREGQIFDSLGAGYDG